jgi:hypothetical protein
MATAFFTELLAATHPPRKSPALPQEKLRAFSLPQDLSVQLMFGAARFGEPVLSVSHSLGFYIVPRRGDSPHRLDTPLKCFNQRMILDATRSFVATCGLNACSGAVFRKQRRAGGRGLPLVCRNAPEVCRKTRHSRAARRTMQLKCFSRQPICHPTKSNFLSSLRANGSRERAPDDRLREAIQSAAKQDWIASSQVLLAMRKASS